MATKGESVKTEVKKEVQIVKKQVKKQNIIKQNGDQNGDANAEAELTVKLPTKKTGAKTETKVEVVQKILPDGSIEEVKTTTTKTTIDGKTEITTRTETKTMPKEEADEEIEEVEEEQEEENDEVVEVDDHKTEKEESIDEFEKSTPVEEISTINKNSQENKIISSDERSETITTKKVVVQQDDEEDEVEEEEEEEVVEEDEPVTTVTIKKPVDETSTSQEETEAADKEDEQIINEKEVVKSDEEVVESNENSQQKIVDEEDEEEEQEIEDEVEEDIVVEKKEETVSNEKLNIQNTEEDVEEEEEYEEATEEAKEEVMEEVEIEKSKSPEDSKMKQNEQVDNEGEEIIKEDISVSQPIKTTEVTQIEETLSQEIKNEEIVKKEVDEDKTVPDKKEVSEEEKTEIVELKKSEDKEKVNENQQIPAKEKTIPIVLSDQISSLREASIPLDKVEDVEIKPIGPASEVIKRSHTENTEIVTSSSDKPLGALSTQTEYNRIENVITVNRTTKTLDHSYENMIQKGIPTVKTYFSPSLDRVLASPQPSRPYQPVFPPEQQTERRHSLLLERLSVERQLPTDIYQNYQNNYEQHQQLSQEPQSEVLTVSNVKPSTITNQEWFQQSRKENIIYNNVPSSAPAAPTSNAPIWSQPLNISQPEPQSQSIVQPQPQYQQSYSGITQDKSNTFQQQAFTTYTPKPGTWVPSNVTNTETLPTINVPSPYYYPDAPDNYQKTTQHCASYVPPPWEQDTSYTVDNSTQNYYQPPPQANTFTSNTSPAWNTAKPPSKFNKPSPTAYIPPAPNQSFVKSVSNVDPPRLPGRKTYYSEYERRYISVPEATYVPGETKFQAQPDPSPQYYYDNTEPNELVEPQWRKELREFTEKSSQVQTEQTSVKPPWEEEPKYVKTPTATYTPTPTWSQTLRPRSWRERSFDSEYIGSQEWPKTNSLGRGRPLSSVYTKNTVESPIPERTRGVSVDRYNPNNYQSPITSEHPPVQAHTLNPATAPHATYHNPNVPAYHARVSTEHREQQSYPQTRVWREQRANPLQSRSFKYLQWITDTEN